jgi:hypothetical protein
MKRSAFDQVDGTLLASGFNRDRGYSGGYRYIGAIAVAGRSVAASLTFDDLEFAKLPVLNLLNANSDCPEVIAHLGRDDEFCFARKEQILLDRYRPGGSVLECLNLAREALERALTRKDQAIDIALEFPQHWLGQEVALVDFRSTTSGSAWFYRIRRRGNKQLAVLADNEHALFALGLSTTELAVARESRQPAHVFRTSRALTLDSNRRRPDFLADFLTWADSVEQGLTAKAITEAASGFPDLTTLFVYGPNGCVGVEPDIGFPAKKLQRSQGLASHLRARATTIPVKRIECSRMDPEYVLSRNLHDIPSLANKRIALIGCGTIGSHLAKLLVQSGAGWNEGCLFLIDREGLVPGNVGRHFLGLRHIGENKAEAMHAELLRLFPEHRIIACPSDAQRQLSQIATCDIVIDATGEEALSRSVNDFFVKKRQQGVAPPILHVWLMGKGDAAQALLVNSPEHACYKCLRVGHDGPWRFNPVLQEHQAELVSGPCGEGMFMAYGVGAPVISAGLGLQMVLDWVAGDSRPNFRTIRLNESRTRSIKNQNPSRQPNCEACGGN